MLNSARFGIAGGIIWGLSVFVMTFIWMYFDYGFPLRDLVLSLYLGYEVSPVGAFIGLIWGFLDAFTGFFLLAWLYNKLGGNE